ncbi:hypothetical protein [Flavobacterium columnare]|uniref:Polysaccharide biosynthesis protein n=1 Tax=Flavobacterium columnare TaxID=996 RepID=A0AA94F2X8_9FLAO|nr:hypothetical protein [Flavobacterium columnare]MCH4829056.1 hypothetical protein [Flavobacterium columnare]MCH4833832.1 hypothetical protein [Flavobacterium columnare]
MSFLKKIVNINIWNFVYSFFSFLSNLLIGRFLGVEVFAEFSVISVYVSLTSLVMIFIPPYVATFKYQDEENFKEIYFIYYCCFSVITIFFNFISWLYLRSTISIQLLCLVFYSFGSIWFNYIDVTLQSQGKLRKYFVILAFSSVVKVLVLLVLCFFNRIDNINDLLFSFGVAQFLMLIYIWKNDPVAKFSLLLKVKDIRIYLVLNVKNYKSYYLNTALKRLQDQIGILMFSFTSSKETLGIFSLLIKSLSFIVSLIRPIEAYFINRENLQNDYNKILNKSIFLGVFCQLVFIPFSVLYLYLMTNRLNYIPVVIISFYFLFYITSTLIRAKYFSTYEIKVINLNQIIYICSIVTSSLVVYFFDLVVINGLTFIYLIANVIFQLNMIYLYKKKTNEKIN